MKKKLTRLYKSNNQQMGQDKDFNYVHNITIPNEICADTTININLYTPEITGILIVYENGIRSEKIKQGIKAAKARKNN